jgi:hypothetical protein
VALAGLLALLAAAALVVVGLARPRRAT